MSWRRQLIAIAMVAAMLGVGVGQPVMAKDSRSFGVAALICESDPGLYTGRDQKRPSYCDWGEGVNLQLEKTDGSIIGACTTDGSGWCHIMTSMDQLVMLRVDEASLPAGYAPQVNPVLRTVTANGAWVTIIPVDALPGSSMEGASLTIHSRFCPPGYAGDDYYGVCHDTPPGFNQTIFVNGPDRTSADSRAASINEDGNVTFDGLPPGDYSIQPGLPDGITRLWSYCSRNGNPDDRLTVDTYAWDDDPARSFVMHLALEPDAVIVCDIYAIPAVE